MGRLFTFIIGFFLISSCAEYTNNLSPSAKARSEYISTCIEMTPGGQSYREACACGFDRGMQLMSKKEHLWSIMDLRLRIQDKRINLQQKQ